MRRICLIVFGLLAAMALGANELPLRVAYNLIWEALSAPTADGGRIILYSETSAGSEDVFAMRLNLQGDAVWHQRLAIAYSSDAERPVSIVATSDSAFVILWHESRENVSKRVLAQKINAEGDLLWHPRGIDLVSPGVHWNKCLAVANDVGGVIVMLSNHLPDYFVWGQSLGADGSALWGEQPIVIHEHSDRVIVMDLVADGDGGCILNFNKRVGLVDFSAHFIRVSASGTIVGANPLLTNLPFGIWDYRLTTAPGGLFVAYSYDKNGSLPIEMLKFNASGSIVPGSYFSYDPGTYILMRRPRLSFYDDGRLILSWEGLVDLQGEYELHLRGFNADMTPAWQGGGVSLPNTSDTEPTHHLDMAPDGTTKVMANGRILGYSPTGQALYPYGGMQITSNGTLKPLVISSTGGTLLLWKEQISGSQSIRKQVLDASGWDQLPYGGLAVEEGLTGIAKDPQVFALQDRYISFWKDERRAEAQQQIFYQVIVNGVPILETNGRALNPGTEYFESPQAAFVIEGDKLALIYRFWAQGVLQVYLQVIGSNGHKQYPGAGVEIFSDGTMASYSTLMASVVGEDIYVAWSRYVAGIDGYRELRAQRISGGIPLWGPIGRTVLEGNPDLESYVDIQADYIVYHQDNTVKVLRLNPQGDPALGWEDGPITALVPTLSEAYVLERSFLAGENLFLILKVFRGMGYEFMAQIINPQGQRLLAGGGQSIFPNLQEVTIHEAIMDSELSIVYRYMSELRLTRLNLDASPFGPIEGISLLLDSHYGAQYKLVRYDSGDYSLFVSGIIPGVSNAEDVYALQITAYGGVEGSVQTLCDASYKQYGIHATALGDRSMAVWSDNRARLLGSSLDSPSIYSKAFQSYTVENEPHHAPSISSISFSSIYPNPFSESISFALESRFAQPSATLSVYNLRGQLVKEVFSGALRDGSAEFSWDGRDSRGVACGSGVYLLKLDTPTESVSRKFVRRRR